MRLVVTGADERGRSRIVSDGRPSAVFRYGSPEGGVDPHEMTGLAATERQEPAAPGEVVVAELWETAPPIRGSEDGRPDVEGFDVEVRPGGMRWRLVEMGPRRATPMHATATIDHDTVLAGSITLLVDEGEVVLDAGDVVVLPAVRHAWRTGASGCTMSVAMVGVEAGEEASA